MHIHGLGAEQSLASLKTTAAGLAADEAARRLAEFGPNHIEEVGREHLLLRFGREFTHFFALILWIGAALALLAEQFNPGQGMARLGVAIVGVIIINGLFSFWQEYKAEQAVVALRQLLPQKVQAVRGGDIVEMLATDLVPGDIVLLEEGNSVPADCRLIEAFALRVNAATVTGESLPKARNAEPSAEDSPLYAKNVVLAGTSVVSGQARAVVYATGMHTEFGRIAHLTLTGMVGLEDPPRPEVSNAIARCGTAGIRIIMVTGDHPHTALAMARQIGLVQTDQPVVVSGDELRSITPTQLQLALDAREIIFARVAAEQKMRIVQALQKKGEIVAVTGDGVNDAPALKVADIGVAMGIAGIDVAKEAADLILLDDNFASIVAAIEEGRAVFENIRKFLTYILSSNIPELVPYLAFVLFRIPLPLTIIQILAVDLGTDMLPALALGAEKPDPAVMQRPPRACNERLLSWGLLARAYLFLGVLEAAGAMAVFFFVLDAAGWPYGTNLDRGDPLYLQATSACLATIVVMQMVNIFLCRHPFKSSLSFGLFSNPFLLLGLATELGVILLIIYTTVGNWLFGTAPIGVEVWLLALACAALMWVLEEVRKAWLRRTTSRIA